MDQIDRELQDISCVEIANAYRAICAAMMMRAAQVMRCKTLRSDEIDMKKIARSWVTAGGGLISFENCCNALDLYEPQAKQAILRYAGGDGQMPIKRLSTRSRLVSPRRKKKCQA